MLLLLRFSIKRLLTFLWKLALCPPRLRGPLSNHYYKGTLRAEEYEKFKPIFNLHFFLRKIIEKSVAKQLTKSFDVNYLSEVFQSADKEFHGRERAR